MGWGGFPERTAWAEDKAKAREAYRAGSKHYDLGEFSEALTSFKEAYRNFEEPTFLFNIAQCHRALGQNEQALRFFRTFLSKVPNAPNRPQIEELIGKIEHELQEERARKSAPLQPAPAAPQPTPAPVAPTPAAPAPAPVAAPPAATTSTPAGVVATSAPAPARRVPVYKKWWLWTVVGVAVVGVGVGLGVGLGVKHDASAETTTGLTLTPVFQ